MPFQRISSLAAILLCLTAGTLHSQPTMRITTISSRQGDPAAELTLRTNCGGAPCSLTASRLQITDNGRAVQRCTIVEHPSPDMRKKISVGLVLDASWSMAGAKNEATRAAARAFVDFMDGDADEATVLWFNHYVSVRNIMIPLHHILYEAIDALPSTGETRLWDAMYGGIVEVVNNGVNEKRAVVVLTDGDDNCSTRGPEEVIQYARQVNMRVFTIALGAYANRSTLQHIARETGGEYYEAPDPSELQNIFLEVAAFTTRGFDEHRIAYTTPDPDAHAHIITVQIDEPGAPVHVTRAEIVDGTESGADPVMPSGDISLDQISPNPFSGETGAMIVYEVRGDGPRHVLLDIYDRLGRRITRLVESELPPGMYTAHFSGSDLPRGAYFSVLRAGDAVESRMMILQ